MAHLVADALRPGYDSPGAFADALAPYAARFGLRRGDGLALLRWLLDLVGDGETDRWMAQAHVAGSRSEREQTAPAPAARLFAR